MALRGSNNVSKELHDAGFDEGLLKPFAQEAIDGLIDQYTSKSDAHLVVSDDLVRVTPFPGKEDKLERYFAKLTSDAKAVVQKLGEACFEQMVLDATHLTLLQPSRVAQFLVDTFKTAGELGIAVKLVASEELPKAMRGFQETKDIRCFSSIEQARSQAA